MLDIEIHARARAAPLAVVLDRRRPRFGETGRPQAPQLLKVWEESVKLADGIGAAVASLGEGTGGKRADGVAAGEDVRDSTSSEGGFGGVLPVPESTDGEEVEVSLSHDEDFVVAMALVTTKQSASAEWT